MLYIYIYIYPYTHTSLHMTMHGTCAWGSAEFIRLPRTMYTFIYRYRERENHMLIFSDVHKHMY